MSGARLLAVSVGALALTAHAQPAASDPRLREVVYDAKAVITVPVRKGEVTLVMLPPDESIADVAAGLGGDCSRPESAWCISAQPGGRNVFIKAKSSAQASNNVAIVSDKRQHALQLVVLGDADHRTPVHRLVIKAPPAPPPAIAGRAAMPGPATDPQLAALATANAALIARLKLANAPDRLISERMQARPHILNAQYSLAEGRDSQDIVPTMAFDDGRFTYLKFPGNREVPAVFHVQGDGTEALLNTRMEDEMLVVDRVARRLLLRAGKAVVELRNEAFDLDGVPPEDGTTVPGIQRVVRGTTARAMTSTGGPR